MATATQQRQSFLRHFQAEKGTDGFTMLEVAKEAQRMGWVMPKPTDPLEILAKQFAEAAREETRRDKKTGRPYRVWHAYPQSGNGQGTLWSDIEDIKRPNMMKSATNRREQIVGDIVQLTFDLDHWNDSHVGEIPIVMEPDFTPDIEWRKNSEDDQQEAA